MADISVSTNETIEITFSITDNGELNDIIKIKTENKEFGDYDFKHVEKFTWTPTDDDVGTHTFEVNGEEISIEVNEIPDNEVYLQDDWGDNKLQNRDGSGTTIYNGVEGFYRPEWTLDLGTPSASNEQLVVSGQQGAYTEISLNFDETITWHFTNFETFTSNDSNDFTSWTLFSASTERSSDNILKEGYYIESRPAGSTDKLHEIDANENVTTLVVAGDSTAEPRDYTVTRSPTGEWEFIVDGTSQGTATDTTHTNGVYTGFGGRRDNSEMRLDEVKVF